MLVGRSARASLEGKPLSTRLPLWVRLLELTGRAVTTAERVHRVVREETLLAWLQPALRGEVTRRVYESQRAYLPGGFHFEAGLFDWEQQLIDSPPFPAQGCILLGGAGAGRELVPLCKRGYEVVAFEPAPELADAARLAAGGYRGARVLQASYDDLVSAAGDGTGPLAEAVRGRTFDAVILGWGSLPHVLDANRQRALLEATRSVAPRGPLLLSYFPLPPVDQGRVERLRVRLRRTFASLGAGGEGDVGRIRFLESSGFIAYFTPQEIVRLASDSGYEVATSGSARLNYALLLPRRD